VAKSGGIVAALLVATAGSGAAYYYFQGQSGGDQPEQLAAAVPENAFMVGYVATDANLWKKLEKFGTPAAQKLITQSFSKFQQDTLAKEQIDYQQDIQPWLGNVMMAFLPTDGQSKQPSLLVVSKVKDKVRALDFLNKMKAKAKTPFKELDYKGTKIFESGSGSSTTYTSSLQDWVIMAGERQTVEKSIDSINGGASFSKKNGNQFFASSNLNMPNPLAAFYVDYAQMVKEINQTSGSSKINLANFEKLNQVKSMAGGIGIEDKGLRMKAIAQTTDQVMKMSPAPGKVLANFPADTIFLSSGNGLKEVWAETKKSMAAQSELQQSMAMAQQAFFQSTKLDLDKDVFGWMGGEYALAIVPANKGVLPNMGLGVSAVFDSTDPSSTNRTLQGLTNLASANGIVTAGRKSNGKDITDLKAPFSPAPFFSYGWLNDRSIFVSMSDMEIKEPLNKSPEFQEIIGSLPQNNLGYLYINFDRALSIMKANVPPAQLSSIPPEVMELLASARGLGATSSQNGNTIQMEGLLVLNPAKNP
jgi:Protein of unknown function (DUF3352)